MCHLQVQNAFQSKTCTLKEELSFDFPDSNDVLNYMTIVDFFSYFVDYTELCKIICKESTRYGIQNGRSFECSPREIVFFAIIFYMGIVRLPAYRDYFRTDDIGQPFVWNALTRERFQEILQNLHFNNNFAEQSKTDKAWKVRTLIEHFNFLYQRYAANVSCQSVDEQWTDGEVQRQ